MAKLTDVKQKAALKNVLKKLSALRLTLRKDERAILDQFVLGMSAEVAGHRYGADLPAKLVGAKLAGAKLAGAKLAGAKLAGAKAEVAGHRYGADLPAKTVGAKLVGAKNVGAKIAGARIVFNAQAGAYQVLD